jgi:hypothetical protein
MNERAVNYRESKPLPKQMQQLLSIGATRQRKPAYGEVTEAQEQYFAIDKLDSVVVRGEAEGLEGVRHSMGVRMARRAIDDIWRLEYFDAYRVENQTDAQFKAVTKYEFEWNESEVLLARRKATLKTEQERLRVRDLGEDILHFYVRDDAAAILDAQIGFERMTHEDCDKLIAYTTAYYEHVNEVNRQTAT